MKVSQLVLTRKWYDMIASGENKGLTHVCFHLGYNQTKFFAIKEIIEDTGKEEWGAEKGETYYVIKLGKEVKNEND